MASLLLLADLVWHITSGTVHPLLLVCVSNIYCALRWNTSEVVESNLTTFYEQFPTLYGEYWKSVIIVFLHTVCTHVGENSATMKLHLVSHIAMCVRNWGPLWSYLCFSFESQNKVIRTLFHGTRSMNKQVKCVYIYIHMYMYNYIQ